MKAVISASLLFALIAVVSAQGKEIAEAQWHLRAPGKGCVEFRHRFGGSDFRIYGCDGSNEPCVFAPHVNVCPRSALYHKPASERVINIRTRDHVVRFYNMIGESCYLSVLPECCSTREEIAQVEADDECKSLTLPTGEVLYDPVDCKPKEAEAAEEKQALAKLLKMLLDN